MSNQKEKFFKITSDADLSETDIEYALKHYVKNRISVKEITIHDGEKKELTTFVKPKS